MTTPIGRAKGAIVSNRGISANGTEITAAIGLNSWAAFAGDRDNAHIAGDIAMLDPEFNPVIRALRKNDLEVVAVHSVAQSQVVVEDVAAAVTELRAVVVAPGATDLHPDTTPRSTRSSTHGPMGFPIHRVLSGTDSPLITSDTGPTVA